MASPQLFDGLELVETGRTRTHVTYAARWRCPDALRDATLACALLVWLTRWRWPRG